MTPENRCTLANGKMSEGQAVSVAHLEVNQQPPQLFYRRWDILTVKMCVHEVEGTTEIGSVNVIRQPQKRVYSRNHTIRSGLQAKLHAVSGS